MAAEVNADDNNDRLTYDPDNLPNAVTTDSAYMRALLIEMRAFNRNVRDVVGSIDKLNDTLSKMRVATSKASK